MADEHDELRTALDRLQAQLDDLRDVDEAVAAQLGTTIEQAKAALAARGKPGDEHDSVLEQLKDAVLAYEASHPTLAGNLGAVIRALGQMGI
jgi:hypothetical protein